MSSEQITQETVPVEKTSTEAQPQATQSTWKILLVKSIETIQTLKSLQR